MLTMTSSLQRAAMQFSHKPAIIDQEGRWTWGEHLDRVSKLAHILRGLGVDRGGRFGILSRNTYRQIELLHAGYWSGSIPVPVNVRLAPKEIAYIVENAECDTLFVEPIFLELFDVDPLLDWKHKIVVIGDADASGLPASEQLILHADPAEPVETQEDDDAILLYTGGTTGRSKGVRLTHCNIVSNGLQVGLELSIKSDDIYFHVAPMFHSADLLGTAVTLMGGAHVALPMFSPENYLKAIETLRPTVGMVAPTMLIMMLQEFDPREFDTSSMRTILYGSAPMAVEWVKKTLEALPDVNLVQGYGLTETSPLLTILNGKTHREAIATGNTDVLKSAGKVLAGLDIKFDDATGQEVMVRGPNVTPGYLKSDEANASAFEDGWFRTGDIGRLDSEGHLYLLDRKKDMIISGGENVYSSEVEAALYQHPDVIEAAVFGLPDSTYGETVSAALVIVEGSVLDADAAIAHCRKSIGGYKIPRRIFFLDELPKSAVNKILKTELRKMFADA
ncbi:MAG: AMP-binding protein [Halieaceae bacterium]|jgi:long-chain acyl-CoA synthetase|nr:AMP-binding protein [Halieaceae bacterium]